MQSELGADMAVHGKEVRCPHGAHCILGNGPYAEGRVWLDTKTESAMWQ